MENKIIDFLANAEISKIEKGLKNQLKKLLPNDEEMAKIETWKNARSQFISDTKNIIRAEHKALYGDSLPPRNSSRGRCLATAIEKWEKENPKPGLSENESFSAKKSTYSDNSEFCLQVKIDLCFNGDTEKWQFERVWTVTSSNDEDFVQVWNVFDCGTCTNSSTLWNDYKAEIAKLFGNYVRM